MAIRRNISSKKGFTVIEVMLFLAVTGLMLLGVLGGTYSSINRQRYNDAVKSYADFLRGIYAEVISPRSNGSGNSSSQAIFGKVIFFDNSGSKNRIHIATLVGSADIPRDSSDFLQELRSTMNTSDAGIYCSSDDSNSVRSYTPLWESSILDTGKNIFTGAIIIARSPVSGNVHTVYSSQNYGDPSSDCNTVSQAIKNNLSSASSGFSTTAVNFCVDMFGVGIKQNVRIAKDGRNSSAIQTLGDSDSSFACH